MSETLDQAEGINININNSDSSAGSSSFLDRIFDIGLKLIIPIGLLLGLILIVVLFQVVLPLIEFAGDAADVGFIDWVLPTGVSGAIAGAGIFFGWIFGR